MRRLKMIFIISLLSLAFNSCDGGTNIEPTENHYLHFMNAPINGIQYSCNTTYSSTKKDNGKDGVATCNKGNIDFYLGTLKIGHLDTYSNNQTVLLQDLLNLDESIFDSEKLLKLAMLILSLDDDGNIEDKINIKEEISQKVTLTSIDNYTINELEEYIKSTFDKTPVSIEKIKDYFIKHSGIPYLQNEINITIVDNQAIDSVVGQVKILENNININEIKMIEESPDIQYKDYFNISNDGKITLNKALDYRTKNQYFFYIQTDNPIGISNIATLNITVQSQNSEYEKALEIPTLNPNTIYTNEDDYTINLTTQKGLNIYIDNNFTQEANDTNVNIAKKILDGDRKVEHSITVGYENGRRSEPIALMIIKDTTVPIFKMPDNISVKENNRTIIDVVTLEENNIDGFKFEVSGIDARQIKINAQGKIEFLDRPNFEFALDYDRDNVYDINISVTDLAGNTVSNRFLITVEDENDNPPTIEPFKEAISIKTYIQNSIGTISFDKGHGEFKGLTLSGEGSEYFKLRESGELILAKQLHSVRIFNLRVTAENEFDRVSQDVLIEVTDADNIAKVELGRLAYSTVKLIKIEDDGSLKIIDTYTTDSIGNFDLKSDKLELGSFYIYQITGGNTTDFDYDKDGIKDDYNTTNKGVARLIIKKDWIKNTSSVVRVTALSEIMYLYGVYHIKNNYSKENLSSQLDKIAQTLIASEQNELNGDKEIDASDIIIFDPENDKDKLSYTLKKEYADIIKKILDNTPQNTQYIKDIFNTKVIKEFDRNGTGCGVTNLCSFELETSQIKHRDQFAYLVQENIFLIYDIYKEETVSHIYLEHGDYDLYLDIDNARVYIFQKEFTLGDNRAIVTIDVSKSTEAKIVSNILNNYSYSYVIGKIGTKLLLRQYTTSNNQLQDTKLIIMNTSDKNNLQELKVYTTIPKFNQAIDAKNEAYAFEFSNNQLILKVYSLNDILNIQEKTRYILNSIGTNQKAYMDEYDGYVYITSATSDAISIYQPTNGTLQLLSSIEDINAEKIVNILKTKLYAYGNNEISLINTKTITVPRYETSFNFYQSVENIYFNKNVMYTNKYMIDLHSLLLSSYYLWINENLRNIDDNSYNITYEVFKDTSIFNKI